MGKIKNYVEKRMNDEEEEKTQPEMQWSEMEMIQTRSGILNEKTSGEKSEKMYKKKG